MQTAGSSGMMNRSVYASAIVLAAGGLMGSSSQANTKNAGTLVGSIVGAYFGPYGSMVGGVIGGTVGGMIASAPGHPHSAAGYSSKNFPVLESIGHDLNLNKFDYKGNRKTEHVYYDRQRPINQAQRIARQSFSQLGDFGQMLIQSLDKAKAEMATVLGQAKEDERVEVEFRLQQFEINSLGLAYEAANKAFGTNEGIRQQFFGMARKEAFDTNNQDIIGILGDKTGRSFNQQGKAGARTAQTPKEMLQRSGIVGAAGDRLARIYEKNFDYNPSPNPPEDLKKKLEAAIMSNPDAFIKKTGGYRPGQAYANQQGNRMAALGGLHHAYETFRPTVTRGEQVQIGMSRGGRGGKSSPIYKTINKDKINISYNPDLKRLAQGGPLHDGKPIYPSYLNSIYTPKEKEFTTQGSGTSEDFKNTTNANAELSSNTNTDPYRGRRFKFLGEAHVNSLKILV